MKRILAKLALFIIAGIFTSACFKGQELPVAETFPAQAEQEQSPAESVTTEEITPIEEGEKTTVQNETEETGTGNTVIESGEKKENPQEIEENNGEVQEVEKEEVSEIPVQKIEIQEALIQFIEKIERTITENELKLEELKALRLELNRAVEDLELGEELNRRVVELRKRIIRLEQQARKS
jgi:hypothetical protein